MGNLPFEVTEQQIRDHFGESCGLQGIENIRVVRDAVTSLGKGIAFVRFESEEAAQAALAAHETSLEGTLQSTPLCPFA